MMRRLRTIVLVISAMAFAVVGGVAVASALLPTPPSLVGQEASEPAGTTFVLGPRVADPDDGPDWTVRTYPSKTDWTCADVGRTDGKAFGRVEADDEIVPLELPELGSCADVKEDNFAIWVNHYPANDDRERTRGDLRRRLGRGRQRRADGRRRREGAARDARRVHRRAARVGPCDGAGVTVTLADGTTHDTKLRPPPPPRSLTPSPAG